MFRFVLTYLLIGFAIVTACVDAVAARNPACEDGSCSPPPPPPPPSPPSRR